MESKDNSQPQPVAETLTLHSATSPEAYTDFPNGGSVEVDYTSSDVSKPDGKVYVTMGGPRKLHQRDRAHIPPNTYNLRFDLWCDSHRPNKEPKTWSARLNLYKK